MAIPSIHEITDLLVAWSEGDQIAMEKLTPLVYQELHRLAQGYLRGERADHTLQTTALVHEAYLRLVDAGQSFSSRSGDSGISSRPGVESESG